MVFLFYFVGKKNQNIKKILIGMIEKKKYKFRDVLKSTETKTLNVWSYLSDISAV